MEDKLKELLLEQQELLIRLVYRKMTPVSCTDRIRVFKDRDEYNKLNNLNWQIQQYLEEV